MNMYSTSEAAKRLGIGLKTLARYIESGKVPAPKFVKAGKSTYHVWTEGEVEHVRQLLPKIANGRKTRYQKLKEKRKGQTKKKKKTR